jgi:hypothetical protein
LRRATRYRLQSNGEARPKEATWTNIWKRAGVDARGPSHVVLSIAAAAGKTQVQVRFHYTGTWAWWWEVDNVFLGSRECVQQSGGLVVGTVTRYGASNGLVGANVASVDQPDENATTVATPADPQLGDGFYWLFSSLTGTHPFTAALSGYSSLTKHVRVRENAVTKAVFALTSGNIKLSPVSISRTVAQQATGHATLTVSNTGRASADVTLSVDPAVTWLTLSRTTFTLAKGADLNVAVSFDAATGPGTYTTAITVTTNTPVAVPSVPVSMTVTP